MASKILLFDENIAVELPAPLRFSLSRKAYQQMEFSQKLGILRRFSGSKTLICTTRINRYEEAEYRFFTPLGCFISVYSAKSKKGPEALFIRAFESSPSFQEQNIALTEGRVFSTNGIIIQVRFKDPLTGEVEEDCGFRDGSTTESSLEYYEIDTSESIKILTRTMAETEGPRPVPEPINKGLEKMLDLAEQYAKLENELDEKNANEAKPLSYISFEGAKNASDRTAATLTVKEFDDKVYKDRSQIIIADRKQKEYTAEIRQAVLPKGGKDGILEILFKEQVDFRDFPQQGTVKPSFNPINMKVQLKAVDRIRNQTSPAFHYMNEIFDGKGFNKFDNKDLSTVDAALSSLENRPNESQINAIKAGINTKNIFLVMGPPGTGKTTVILEWIKYFVKEENYRVLVSSQNNKAVDNVLERIKDEPGVEMLRIGTELKVEPSVRDFLLDKKVETLRKRIEHSTSGNTEILQDLFRTWGEVGLTAKQLQDAKEVMSAYWAALCQETEKTLRPSFQRLCDRYDEYEVSAKRITACGNRIRETMEQLEAWKHKKFLWKLISWWPIYKHRKTLGNLFDEFAALRAEEARIISAYREEYGTYITQKETLSGGLYRHFTEARETVSQAKETLGTVLLRPLPDALGLFAWVKEKLQSVIAGVSPMMEPYWESKDFCADVRNELSRCKGIMGVLKEWQREVLGRQNYSLQSIIFDEVNLVGATCIGVNSQQRFAGLKFDTTIIDEAGQIQLHKVLVPMSVSGKLIMLGDHKQIPPNPDEDMKKGCIEHEIPVDFLSKSLFEAMYESFPDTNKTMLDTQYRMPGEIADTLSKEFYGGLGHYKSWDGKRGKDSVLPFLSNKPYIVIDTSGAGSRRFEEKMDEGYCNKLEADIIAAIVQRMYRDNLKEKEIGIITGYKKQVRAIVKRLIPIMGHERADEVTATLDSFQGQERHVILYSFTRSSKRPADVPRIGFLRELRRLNVAMSRPKETLVLIGDMPFLASCANMPPAEYEGEDEEKRYQKSEKRFGAFIRQMIADVREYGAYLTYDEFLRQMEG